MNKLRTLLAAAGLGFFIDTAMAQENTEVQPNRAEVRKQLFDTVERVDFDSWKNKILDYDGAAMVLFSSSCVIPEDEHIDRNMELVFIQLVNNFYNVRVSELPIRFFSYDSCGKSKADLLGVTTLETHMYLDGRRIDTRIGGPVDITKTEGNVKAMSAWIETQLLDKTRTSDDGRRYVWAYEQAKDIHKIYLE